MAALIVEFQKVIRKKRSKINDRQIARGSFLFVAPVFL
jgi:hypothetical protein